MTAPTIITSPSGDRLAVVPLAEYERLVDIAEKASDVRAYDEAKRKLASGEEELVPADAMKRILDGESPVRVWRELRGMTAKELAVATGISAPFLSQIEQGTREGGLSTMKNIAETLSVSLDDLT